MHDVAVGAGSCEAERGWSGNSLRNSKVDKSNSTLSIRIIRLPVVLTIYKIPYSSLSYSCAYSDNH